MRKDTVSLVQHCRANHHRRDPQMDSAGGSCQLTAENEESRDAWLTALKNAQ